MSIRAFWDAAPCSFVGVDRRFKGAYCLHHQGDESFIALMMEVVRTSETPVYSTETARRYIPGGCILHRVSVNFTFLHVCEKIEEQKLISGFRGWRSM
jgi:hypothetical protein